jgi:Pectinacetylesterase
MVEAARDETADPGEPATASVGVSPTNGSGLGAQADEWTWLDFPDSRCANGAPTGIAVNVHPQGRHLVVFLEGGGACDSGAGCWVTPTAVNIATGYGVQQLGSDPVLGLPLFDRGDPGNPFADASYVVVPYCTGDLHAGNGVATYEVDGQPRVTYHLGAHNLDLYLERLGGSFPAVDHAWLVGQSAGGFGTLFNQSFVASAFGVPTDVIDDSGPGIGVSGYPPSWNVRLPPGCDDCASGLAPLFLHDRHAYPGTRFAFLSFQVDTALPGFYGVSEQQVVLWLQQYEQSFSELPGTGAFVVPGAGHVVMGGAIDGRTREALSVWLTEMVTDDPDWGRVANHQRP